MQASEHTVLQHEYRPTRCRDDEQRQMQRVRLQAAERGRPHPLPGGKDKRQHGPDAGAHHVAAQDELLRLVARLRQEADETVA